ncbi:hypothetical protein JCM10914A_16280 [Paenibacillus sp. JCM 10914]|uniref:PepSY domain-containing protein n=1 Tax=Paenibacillus sp. JCM 10914 TaxID=1236974 RepID=UPI0003CC7DE8|nr:PepSY domain-containing protein [Paenibacillus sp. JCM 10914]GAE06720.1 hypothetical protein JCM10914_2893 [Paenibacillus sp. JCM 10914]
MRNKIGLILGSVLVAAGLIVTAALWNPLGSTTTALSSDEAVEHVLGQYDGEVMETVREGDAYRLVLQSETGRYELRVDAYTGGMVSINQLSAAEPEPDTGLEPNPDSEGPVNQPDSAEGPTEGAPGDPKDPGAADFPTTMITKEQAVKLSLEKVAGTIEDVEYRESKRSRYYLVEIEQADGREATVQVHAITGEIMSLTWDDEDND